MTDTPTVEQLRSDVFAILRRHDVSEQCFAEVAMVTHAFRTQQPRPIADAIRQQPSEGSGVMGQLRHCDEYIDDPAQPACLRKFLNHVRSPAHGMVQDDTRPQLFADYAGERVRVVMASRLGDVGITKNLSAERGYTERVAISDLANFGDCP